MELPLKHRVKNYYIFCKTEIVNDCAVLQWNQPITKSAISGYLRNIGKIYSFLQSIFVYHFCYRERKILNKNSAVSKAQQNLIIKYTDICIFLNHYLPHYINTDIQSVINSYKSNKSLMHTIICINR